MRKTIHAQQLNTSKHFLQSQVKHMLPYYQPQITTNMFTIMQYYISHGYPQKDLILCADETLTPQIQNHPLYTHIQTVFCEDFDGQDEHLSKTLSLATNFINYIYTFNSKKNEQLFQSFKAAKKINNQYEDFIKRDQILIIQNNQVNTIKPAYISKVSEINNVRLVSYNFIKNKGQILLNLACNICHEDSIGILLTNIRNWNLNRLGVTTYILERLSSERLQKITQHMFIQGRTFLRINNPTSEDYNTYSVNLKNFLKEINKWAVNNIDAQQQTFHQQILASKAFNKLSQSEKLTHQLKLIKIQITTKSALSEKSIWKIASESVIQWLMQSPLNASCSYASFLQYEQKDPHITMWLGLYYLSNQNSNVQHKYLKKQNTLEFANKVQRLLVDQKALSAKIQNPIEENMKKSFAILNKYQEKQQLARNTSLSLSRSRAPKTSQINPPAADLNQSFVSNFSTSSQARKINMKRIAKLQNQIYETLKLLQSNSPILNPTQMQKKIDDYCQHLSRKYEKYINVNSQGKNFVSQNLNPKQYLMFESLQIVVEELTPQDINLLLKHNPSEIGPILSTLMQINNYDKMVTLGKIIGLQNLENLFRKSLEKGLREDRHSIIIYYLKKMIESYSPPQSRQVWKPLLLQQISIPQLLQLLQTKFFNESSSYGSILNIILPQLFSNQSNLHPQLNLITVSHIKIISPLLYLYTEHLLRQDHHHQLVYSFIGQIMFQVIYYWKQAKLNTLSNAMYIQNGYQNGQLSLKQKKIMQIIRQGGFQGFGYEIKMRIYSLIQQNKTFRVNDANIQIYNILKIQRSLDAYKFFKVLANSHINQRIIRFGKFYKKKQFFHDQLKKARAMICFLLNNRQQSQIFPVEQNGSLNQQQQEKNQYQSISRRILSSQSGIFYDMAKLNPKLKIAGIQLNSAIRELSVSRKLAQQENTKKKGIIEPERAKQSIITQQVQYNYQLVELALSLKAKYIQYHLLNEQQKTYFRQCAQNVTQNKEKIRKYILLSNQIKTLPP